MMIFGFKKPKISISRGFSKGGPKIESGICLRAKKSRMAGPEDGVEESAAKMWRDERWLQSNELNENSVLDYFALSDWYTDAISLPPFPSSPPLPLTSWLQANF